MTRSEAKQVAKILESNGYYTISLVESFVAGKTCDLYITAYNPVGVKRVFKKKHETEFLGKSEG